MSVGYHTVSSTQLFSAKPTPPQSFLLEFHLLNTCGLTQPLSKILSDRDNNQVGGNGVSSQESDAF